MIAASAIAQTPDDLFNPEVLHEIRLFADPRDWASLRINYELNTYYAADMVWLFDGREILTEQVGIRSRGLGSRNSFKPGLLIDFNRYNETLLFLGLRSIVLRNNAQDASMMREHLGMTFFRRMGIPAPRTSFARLFVNGEYAGLYTVVESIDTDFIQRHFGQQNGYLYNYDYGILDPPYFFEYRGLDPGLYSPRPFQPENHKRDPNAAPIEAMIRTMNQASDEEFFAAMSQYLDMPGFVRYLAIESFLAEQDGIVGDFGLNNLYLYRFEGSNRSQFIPWDKSQVFVSIDREFFRNIHSNVLAWRALAVPELRAAYVNGVLESAASAGGPGGWLEQEIARVYAQIGDAVRTDPKKLCYGAGVPSFVDCSNEEFEASAAFLMQFARERNDFLMKELFPPANQP